MKIGTTDINNVYIGSTAVNTVYIGTTQIFPNVSLLLDTYSGAAVAYSVRKLRTAYGGSAIRVRRSSDNTEQDIGFSGNDLDTSALTTFCSGTNGFVVTWYDQSGNSRNATQSTAANQPKIYDSITGVLTDNSEPTMTFDGTDYFEISDFAYNSYADLYSAIVCQPTDTSNRNYAFGQYDTNNNRVWVMAYESSANGQKIRGAVSDDGLSSDYRLKDTTANWSVAQQLTEMRFEADVIELYINGTEDTGSYLATGTVTTLYNSASNLTIGRILTSALFFKGNIQECMFWASDQSSNRSSIASNINSHYTIY